MELPWFHGSVEDYIPLNDGDLELLLILVVSKWLVSPYYINFNWNIYSPG